MGSSNLPAFEGCTAPASLTIGEAVTTIPNYAFYSFSGLTSVTIGKSVTTIGYSAFKDCSSLTSVIFNAENCTKMSFSNLPVFEGCTALASLTIGEAVTTIPKYAFADCTNLSTVTSRNLTPPVCASASVFAEGIQSTCELLVNYTCKNKYATAPVWKDFLNITTYVSVAAESLTLSPSSSTLTVGDAADIRYIISPDDVSIKDLEWSVSDPAIASVVDHNDGTATITALSVGEVTITARTTDGSDISATCTVKVEPILATSLTLSCETANLKVGDSTSISCTFSPDNATTKAVEWEVDKPGIVSLTDNGDGSVMVSAIAVGDVTITARTTDGSDLTATCSIKTFVMATSLTLSAERLELPVGKSEVISYTILPENATGKGVAWKSSDPTVASILYNTDGSSITVVAKSEGTATITARTTDGSDLTASCEVKILPPLASSLTLSAEQLAMNVGDHEVITYTILPEDTGDKSVAWTSSDPRSVSISTNADGSVTVNALAIGEATITARTLDGSNLTASCVVKVGNAAVDDVDAEGIEIIATAEGIVVKGAPADSVIDVYTASGVLVYHGYDSLIAIRNHGIYLVCVAGVKVKVAL